MTAASLLPVEALMVAASIPVLAAAGYLGFLAVIARRAAAPASARGVRFDVIVPAHDEEAGIAATVTNLRDLDYPRDAFRVVVVADNCGDATAECARGAGAFVLERRDETLRGKGYALAHAFEASLALGDADAVVVVDADTLVSPNLLTAFAARIERGAEAVQAEYGVRNPTSSWRTRLMVIAFTLFHTLRSLARERLGLSSGLRGNGMCFRSELLRRVPHRAFSVVEDIEYGITLGLAGVRVAYAAEAEVWGDMPATERASRSQRERWEGGRVALLGRYLRPLLRTAWARRDRVPLDLAADLLVPPLAPLGAASAVGTAAAAALYTGGIVGVAPVVCWGVSLGALLLYVVRGSVLSGVGPRAAIDLLWAPVYAAWKVTLLLRPRGRRRDAGWVRTARSSDR